jgi:hypothetical protein
MSVKLGTPRLRVVITEDSEEAVMLQTIGADQVAAEVVARRHKWGKIEDSPMTWLSYMAWHGLRRKGFLDKAVTWEAFTAELGSIEDATPDDEDDEDDDAAGTPTGPDRASG